MIQRPAPAGAEHRQSGGSSVHVIVARWSRDQSDPAG